MQAPNTSRQSRSKERTMKIEAEWMRGGTSKCWVFETEQLGGTGTSPDVLLPRLFGSPDHRQIDGVGGATSTTSKAMILHRPAGGDVTKIVTRNTNTGQIIIQRVSTPSGALPIVPEAQMPGVPFPGYRVGLGFQDPAGKTTGKLL